MFKPDFDCEPRRRAAITFIGLCLLAAGCSPQPLPRQQIKSTTGSVTIQGDVWVDNWFALYLGDELLIEDSVSITTERSFNGESFSFKADFPIVLNFIVKDFKENESGLEYIGTSRQQMGDGGFIAQFVDASTGKPIAVTDANWRCMVVHRGPLDEACEGSATVEPGESPCEFESFDEPSNWRTIDFDDSDWDQATVYSASEVRPKDGYDQINWHFSAKLIWSADLKKDNTVLMRLVIEKGEVK